MLCRKGGRSHEGANLPEELRAQACLCRQSEVTSKEKMQGIAAASRVEAVRCGTAWRGAARRQRSRPSLHLPRLPAARCARTIAYPEEPQGLARCWEPAALAALPFGHRGPCHAPKSLLLIVQGSGVATAGQRALRPQVRLQPSGRGGAVPLHVPGCQLLVDADGAPLASTAAVRRLPPASHPAAPHLASAPAAGAQT